MKRAGPWFAVFLFCGALAFAYTLRHRAALYLMPDWYGRFGDLVFIALAIPGIVASTYAPLRVFVLRLLALVGIWHLPLLTIATAGGDESELLPISFKWFVAIGVLVVPALMSLIALGEPWLSQRASRVAAG